MLISVDNSETPNLSVVLPALKCDAEFMRCIWSIRAACSGIVSYEIISVVKTLETFGGIEGSDIRIIPEEHPGVYAGMNTGLRNAIGLYVYFIGQDDILLPSVAEILRVGSLERTDLLVSNVFWGNRRVYKNRQSSRSLIWRNWCHQGVVYRREFLRESGVSFQEEFKTQADHYLNIVTTGHHGATIMKYHGCIAWYSADGVSTTTKDAAFRSRFPSLIRENFGFPSFLIVVIRRAMLRIFRMVIHR